MQAKLRLDGVVTVVDAKHCWEYADDSPEAREAGGICRRHHPLAVK
jgi:G3E family GTPase